MIYHFALLSTLLVKESLSIDKCTENSEFTSPCLGSPMEWLETSCLLKHDCALPLTLPDLDPMTYWKTTFNCRKDCADEAEKCLKTVPENYAQYLTRRVQKFKKCLDQCAAQELVAIKEKYDCSGKCLDKLHL